ncbi:MAG TPA: hypothetical protein VMV10_26845 [Pirellulales bacterium]|nr:hypothetical protein [Pirellulales bacterium]
MAAKNFGGKATMSPASSDHVQRARKHDEQFGIPIADASVYAPFESWLDEELERLVARWIHLAAPNASRREQALRRSARSNSK